VKDRGRVPAELVVKFKATTAGSRAPRYTSLIRQRVVPTRRSKDEGWGMSVWRSTRTDARQEYLPDYVLHVLDDHDDAVDE
jgi:hypothetical protein